MAQIFPIDFEEKLTMAQDDYILFSDSEDGNKIKKAQYKNLKGEKWDTWATWPQWPQGIQWPQGEQGIQWPQWEQWEQGIQWEQGEQWPQGETWPQWPKGDTWAKWDTWATGATWPQWPQWPTWATGNWISTITETTSWKVHTITITETDGDTTSFTVSDWADGEWSGDVIWPNSSVDGNVALFDGNTWKLIKDWWALPSVVNNLTSTSTTDALSAAQWKALKDAIDNISWLWKFLSLWDSATWQPISFPLATPYAYTTWDWFMVETVWTTNYKPNGSSYTWTASITVETETVEQWDVYIYDWTNWLLQKNNEPQVSFSEIAWQPTDNTNLATALNAKQDTLTAWTWIDITSNTVSTASNFWKSTTAAATTQKEVSIPWIKELHEWQVVHILPSTTSTVANSTLKVNNFTAYPMRYNNAAITTSTDSIVRPANIVTSFVFDWTYWQFIGHGLDSNTTYSNMSASEATTWTATSGRTISASVLKWAIQTHAPVQSVNWQTWAVTVNEWDVKVFAVPSVNDDISDMLTRLSAWKWVILHEMVSWTDAFYKVDYYDSTWVIDASLISDSAARFYTITYSYLDNTVTSKTSSTASFFAPATAGTQWQVLTKTASGYEWQAPTEPTVVSGDSGVTYTIKVSNSDPASWTASNIVTLVP